MNHYNYNIDYCIAKALSQSKKELGYREVKKLIELPLYIGKSISRDVFDYHIKKMRERGELLEKNIKLKRGQKNPLQLSDKTKQEILLDIYDIKNIIGRHRFFKKGFSEKEKRRLAYQFLLYAIDEPYTIISTIESGIRRFSANKIKKYHTYGTEFFSHIEYGTQIIDSSIESLQKGNIIEVIKKDNDILFDFKDKNLKGLVYECKSIFDKVFLRMYIQWQNFRRPNREEYDWLNSIYGEKNAKEKFNKLWTNLKNNKVKPNYNLSYKKEKRTVIDALDISLHDYLTKIKTKYDETKTYFPSLFEMIVETVYPKFFQDHIKRLYSRKEQAEHMKIVHPNQYQYFRNLPKIKMSSFRDSLVIKDNTKIKKNKIT